MQRETWRTIWQALLQTDCNPQLIVETFREAFEPHENQQVEKNQTRYDYTQGPVYYLLQQIVKAMQDAGYPCKIAEFYRSPTRQAELLAKRPPVTKAGPYQSAHQYFCAGDLIHPSKGWDVSEQYWETLATCVRIVAQKFDVELDHGHYWRFRDSAHIQLADWRDFKALIGERKPESFELANLFAATLPAVVEAKGAI